MESISFGGCDSTWKIESNFDRLKARTRHAGIEAKRNHNSFPDGCLVIMLRIEPTTRKENADRELKFLKELSHRPKKTNKQAGIKDTAFKLKPISIGRLLISPEKKTNQPNEKAIKSTAQILINHFILTILLSGGLIRIDKIVTIQATEYANTATTAVDPFEPTRVKVKYEIIMRFLFE